MDTSGMTKKYLIQTLGLFWMKKNSGNLGDHTWYTCITYIYILYTYIINTYIPDSQGYDHSHIFSRELTIWQVATYLQASKDGSIVVKFSDEL